MILNKKCLICGKPLKIEIDDKTNKILTPGVFFTKMELPTKDAKVIKEYKSKELKINNEPVTVVEHDKYEEVEYWECPRCCADEIIAEETGINLHLFKQWIKKDFGERCPDYEKGCPVCDVYKLYDELEELLEVQYDDEVCAELVEEEREKEELKK